MTITGSRPAGLRPLPVLAAGLVLALACATAAGATEGKAKLQPAAKAASAASLNLLSAPRKGQPVVRVRAMGNGSWICSPAGFGQRSRCYQN